MKQTVNFAMFVDTFRSTERFDHFGYDGLGMLFEYLEELEESTGVEEELDVAELCGRYARASVEDIANDYSIDIDGLEEDDAFVKVMEYLMERTAVCGSIEGCDSIDIIYNKEF
jgi:hypothetical protein